MKPMQVKCLEQMATEYRDAAKLEGAYEQTFRQRAGSIDAALVESKKLRDWVERTAQDPNLRSRRACYHARRVALEAGALLAEMNGLYRENEKGKP
jgi:hypothetical protein